MGCGKSLTAIAVMGAGYQMGKIRRVLIAAPASVCTVWPNELAQYAAFPYTVRVLLGTKKQRLQALCDLTNFPGPQLKIAVINYEAARSDSYFDRLMDYDADLIIADESQRIKTHNAVQSKAMHQLGDKARCKLILSGTPIQNEAVDIFSQYRFLDSSVFGDNFYAFRNRYCIMGGFNRKQIVQYRDLDTLTAKKNSISYRVTKADALDLPAQIFQNRCIPMGQKERTVYDRLRRDSFAELEGGGTITAPTVLTKLLRLQQFTGGFLAEDDGTRPRLVNTSKLDALEDILHDYVVESRKKLVVFARFLPEIHAILALCEKILSKTRTKATAIYGDIPKEKRGAIVQQFQTDPATTVIVGQIDTMGAGITLTAADTCVYYSVGWNFGAYEQSLARIHRIGQKNKCLYIHLVAENSIDGQVLAALRQKKDLAKTILDDWRNIL